VNELAMAMMGFPIISRFMPLAIHSARAPDMRRPSVLVALLNACFISFYFLCLQVNMLLKIKIAKLARKSRLYQQVGCFFRMFALFDKKHA
jgi:hypothetical protein